MQKYKLRPYTTNDYADVVRDFESETTLKKYTNQGVFAVLAWLGIYKSNLFVLEDENGIVVAEGVVRSKLGRVWLYGIKVKTSCRGMGYGKILMQELLDVVKLSNVKQVQLVVATNNIAANHLYESLNFRKINRNNNNYIMQYTYD